MAKIVEFQRPSLGALIAELREDGPKAKGTIAVWLDEAGHGHFRISGFNAPNDAFLVCGLLDWIQADLLSDMVTQIQG